MNTSRFGPASGSAAVVLAVAVLAMGCQAASATPSPSPVPTVAATPQPTVAVTPSPLDGRAPGPYVLWRGGGFPDVDITIPASGWYGDEEGNGILVKHDNADAPDGLGMIGPFVGDLYVPSDPCRWESTMPAAPASTVDEFVVALQAQATREASAPVDITVDGHAGKSMTLHVPDDVVIRGCDDGVTVFSNEGQFCTLGERTGAECARYAQDPGQIDELLILDVDGVLQVIDGAYYAGTPAADVAEMHAIFDSITFGE